MELMQCIFFLLSYLIYTTRPQATDDEYGDCRPLYTHNYGYKIYFHIPKVSVLSPSNINFIFSVQTSSDAHILLSTTPNPKDSDPVYEIVLGAGWNTFSDIRRLHQSTFRATNITRNVVSKNNLRKFWIKLIDGLISVGEGNFSVPFIQYRDMKPLIVNYMSFSSWHGTTAKWFFDCFGATSVAVNKTASERLRSVLFSGYDPYVTPLSDDDYIIINTNLSVSYIELNSASSSMDMRGRLRVKWVDYKLQWSPTDYEGNEIIRITERQIWQPAFVLYNGATRNQKWFDDGILTVDYEGHVTWTTSVHFITRCDINMKNWPADDHTCSIQIGLYGSPQNVHLADMKDVSLENNGASIWELQNITGYGTYLMPPWDKALPDFNSTDAEVSSVLVIEISMRRYSSLHYYLFCIPIRVTMVISAISFCLPYTCFERLILQVLVLVKNIINLLTVTAALPTVIQESPAIVSLSCGMLMVALIGSIATVGLIQLSYSEENFSVPNFLDELVNFFSLRMNFFSNNGSQKLMNLEDDEEGGTNNETKQPHEVTKKSRFRTFLLLLDYFLLFSILISYIILEIIF